MTIPSDEWIEVAEKYCEHYDVDETHYGELKCLKKDAPDSAKKLYSEQIKIWQKKGWSLPEDADGYL